MPPQMIILCVILGIVALIAVLVLLTSLVCFFMTFYSPKRKKLGEGEYDIPNGKIYEAHREQIIAWTKDIRKMPHERITIKSFDGLTLVGNYYEHKKGAPTELLFHGYRGNSERDLCGGVHRCFALGRNALIIDHRASGESEGSVISFGINERHDCVSWANYASERFGSETRLILTGISMGAATVMLASAERLPENVVCILADCGYSSAREIIKKVICDMHLSPGFFYPFVRLGARIFGGFDLEETSPEIAVSKTKIPMIFIHGESDDYVPCDMSRELYEKCSAEKKSIVTIPGAGHGLAFPVDQRAYLKALEDFEDYAGFLKK